jgi:hypothetical protein
VLSNHKLQVNYEITIPENTASVTVINRFGDVNISDVSARIDVTVAHGNLRLNDVDQFSRINMNYGKAKISRIREASIDLKSAELDLGAAEKLNLTSSSSTVQIGSVAFADLQSTNDKITIESAGTISGDVNFTTLNLYFLEEDIRLDQSYGEVAIKGVDAAFNDIRLTGKSTDYTLFFPKNSTFDLRVFTRDDKLVLPDFPGKIKKRYTDEKSKFVEATGYIGKENSGRKVNIDAQGGLVKLVFVDPAKENYNK